MRDLLTVNVRPEENVYLCRSLETGEKAVMFAAPIRLGNRQRWSWKRGRVVLVNSTEARKLARIRFKSRPGPVSESFAKPLAEPCATPVSTQTPDRGGISFARQPLTLGAVAGRTPESSPDTAAPGPSPQHP